MKPAPDSEALRLQALRDLLVLDSEPEPLFDQLTQMASALCQVPVALVSLVDAERQWFKARVGLPGVNETPRDIAFCAHAIQGDAVFEVPDATADARFQHNPLVTGSPDIRFYAGAPLVLAGGERVGTLCVIDRQPRQLRPEQAQRLQELAKLATQALVMRRDLLHRALNVRTRYEQALADSEARYRAIVETQEELVSLARPDGTLEFVNTAYAQHCGLAPAQMLGRNLVDFVAPEDRETVRQHLAQVLAGEGVLKSEHRMLAADGSVRWVAWTNRLQPRAEGGPDQPPLVHSVGRDITERRVAESALRASQSFLSRTGRVAGVGGWELDLQTQALLWSEETRRIHGVGPDYEPTVDAAIAFYAPEARAQIQAVVQRAMQQGQGWDLELPFITADGRHIWVRAAGEVEFEQGQPRRLVGAFQDITERRQLQQRLADSEHLIRLVTDSLPVRLAYIDRERRYRFVNHAHTLRFGRPRDAIIGHTRSELTGGVSDAIVEPRYTAALAGQPQHYEYEDVVQGEPRRIEVQLVPDLDAQGQVRGFFASGTDVTDRVSAQRLLQRQTATLLAVLDALPAIVSVMEADGRFRMVNTAFERWAGQPRDAVLGRSAQAVLGEEAARRSAPWVQQVLAGETVSFEFDDPVRSGAPGATRHLAVSLVPLRDEAGQVEGYLSMCQDVTRHRQEAVRLLHLAQRDPLTGLLNRRGALERFGSLLAEGDPAGLALLCVDLDHFKPVNDQHGHAVGDQLLQALAQRLQRVVRPSDAVARLGGDEFTLLLAGVRAPADARKVADKVIRTLSAPVSVGGLRLQVGASIGLALGALPGVAAETAWAEMLARADSRLYEAKASGRGRQVGAVDAPMAATRP